MTDFYQRTLHSDAFYNITIGKADGLFRIEISKSTTGLDKSIRVLKSSTDRG